MPDYNFEPVDDPETPENAIAPKIGKALNKEAKELKSAEYVLNEELIYMLENPNIVFTLEREPERIFNEGCHDDTLVYDDEDFNMENIKIINPLGQAQDLKELASIYERYDLREPSTKKMLRINQITFNHAYFEFNTLEAGTLDVKKQKEVAKIQDYLDGNRKSAFDKTIENTAKKETISISFDGYIYSFSKIVHKNGGEHIELEIEQYNKEDSGERKCLRRANVLEDFGVEEYEHLKTSIQDTVKRSKPKDSNF